MVLKKFGNLQKIQQKNWRNVVFELPKNELDGEYPNAVYL